jgi:hypothetical protein
MKVQSTGLGKTVMLAQFKELLKTDFDNHGIDGTVALDYKGLHGAK